MDLYALEGRVFALLRGETTPQSDGAWASLFNGQNEIRYFSRFPREKFNSEICFPEKGIYFPLKGSAR